MDITIDQESPKLFQLSHWVNVAVSLEGMYHPVCCAKDHRLDLLKRKMFGLLLLLDQRLWQVFYVLY